MSHQVDLKRLIAQYNRRLQKLREKEAQYGLETPVSTLTEIEDIEAKIKELQEELTQANQQQELEITPGPIHTTNESTSNIGRSKVWIAQIRSVSIAIVLIGLIGGVVLFFWGNNPTSNNTPTPTPTATILPTPTNTPTPTMTPPPLVTIEQMLLSTSREYYRLEATLENPLQQSVLIRFLTVTIIKSDNDSWGCSGEDTIYKVSDNIEVGNTDEKGSTPFWGTVTEGNFSSFSYQVEGEFVQGCAGAVLIFGFDTSIELPAGKNMTIYLLLPRTWQVTGLEESFLRDKDEPISQQINYELEVPKDGYDLLRIELEVDTKTGTITGSKEFERF